MYADRSDLLDYDKQNFLTALEDELRNVVFTESSAMEEYRREDSRALEYIMGIISG